MLRRWSSPNSRRTSFGRPTRLHPACWKSKSAAAPRPCRWLYATGALGSTIPNANADKCQGRPRSRAQAPVPQGERPSGSGPTPRQEPSFGWRTCRSEATNRCQSWSCSMDDDSVTWLDGSLPRRGGRRPLVCRRWDGGQTRRGFLGFGNGKEVTRWDGALWSCWPRRQSCVARVPAAR